MASIALVLLTLTSIVLAQDECEDGLKPIYIDFHDRNVSDNDQNNQYGLFIGVGTPFQNQSLWPSISHNETTFSSPDICEDNDNERCIEQTHGFYSPEDSDTFVNISQADFTNQILLDTTPTDPATVALTGNDTLNIYTHYFDPSPATVTHITDFPISQLTAFASNSSPWYGPSGLLGLAPSSPILTHLYDLNLITTRSFGLYLGTAYPRAGGAINGSLTLGGYDSGRLTGDTHTFDLATDYDVRRGETPFRVEISTVVLSSTAPDNSTTNETLSSSPFTAYLTTSQHSLTLPRALTESFINTTSASTQPNTFSEPSLHLPASSTNYTLTITLSSGLVITIPADEMRNASNASPLSESPSAFAAPNTSSSSNSSSSGDPEPPTLLGTAFLHHLYLTAQYSSLTPSPNSSPPPSGSSPYTTPPQFHLTAANPHGPYVLPAPLCVGSVPREGEPVPGGGLSAWDRNGIVGAVLGGVIGGVAVGWVGWWVWVRRRRRGREGGSGPGKGRWWRVGGKDKGIEEGGEGGDKMERRGLGKQWADAEDEEMRGWVIFAGRLRRLGKGKSDDHGKEGKGKGKAVDGYVDVQGKSVSDNDGSSDDNDDDRNGYGMRQFSPVAIPAAYGVGGGRDRVYPTTGAEATATTAVLPAGVAAAAEIPFDFTPHTFTSIDADTDTDINTDAQNSRTDLAAPTFPDIQHHDSNNTETATPLSLTSPSSVSWQEVTDVGRAISTPALLVDVGPSRSVSTRSATLAGPAALPTVVAVGDGDGHGEQRRAQSMVATVEQPEDPRGRSYNREGDALTLRSISPVSPLMEEALFWGGVGPEGGNALVAVGAGGEKEKEKKVDDEVIGAESWILSRRGSEHGLLMEYAGKARTGKEIKITNKIPRKMGPGK